MDGRSLNGSPRRPSKDSSSIGRSRRPSWDTSPPLSPRRAEPPRDKLPVQSLSPRAGKRCARPWTPLITTLDAGERRRHESVLGVLSEAALSAAMLQNGLSPAYVKRHLAVPTRSDLELPKLRLPNVKATLDKMTRELSPSKIVGRVSPSKLVGRLSPARKCQAERPSHERGRNGATGGHCWTKVQSAVTKAEVLEVLKPHTTFETRFPTSARIALPELLSRLEATFPKYEPPDPGLSNGNGVRRVRQAVVANMMTLSRLLNKYDTDKSGELDKAEFVGLITALISNPRSPNEFESEDIEVMRGRHPPLPVTQSILTLTS